MTGKEKNETKVRAALARKEALSPQERQDIAARAARTRWLRATHTGSFKKDFGIDVDCYVLNDEQKTAVISQRGMGAALGLGRIGSRLPEFIRGQRVAPYVGRELGEKLSNPLIFRWLPPDGNSPPTAVYGYDVTLLIDLCKAIVSAEDDGKLLKQQGNVVRQAHVILNASAKAGIKGLVYALAGYDATREETIAAFKLYVQQEAKQYESEFSEELYEHWYRLYGIQKPQRGKNWKLRHLTIDHVYVPLARSEGKILAMLKEYKASSSDKAKAKLFQFLSDVGTKALRTHLGRLLGMADVSKDKVEYEAHVARVFGRQLELFNSPSEP